MKIGLISTCPDIVKWAASIGLAYTHHAQQVDDATALEELLSGLLDSRSSSAVDCLFVDVSTTDPEKSWITIDRILQTYLQTTPHLLKCLVAHVKVPIKIERNARWAALVPQQSCVTKNGQVVDIDNTYVGMPGCRL